MSPPLTILAAHPAADIARAIGHNTAATET
jgi:hypothetical protein